MNHTRSCSSVGGSVYVYASMWRKSQLFWWRLGDKKQWSTHTGQHSYSDRHLEISKDKHSIVLLTFKDHILRVSWVHLQAMTCINYSVVFSLSYSIEHRLINLRLTEDRTNCKYISMVRVDECHKNKALKHIPLEENFERAR